jgi:hypothetical protein
VEPDLQAGLAETRSIRPTRPEVGFHPRLIPPTGHFYWKSSLTTKIMLTKFAIDYVVLPKHNKRVSTHFTDDPVEAEDFLMHLLLARAGITGIRHEGSVLTGHQFDKMLKTAAERVASSMLRESLVLDAAEIKDRFGFAA